MGQIPSVIPNINENGGYIFKMSKTDSKEYTKYYYFRIIGKQVLREKQIMYNNGKCLKYYHILNINPKELDIFLDKWRKLNVSFITAYNHPTLSEIWNTKAQNWIYVKRDIKI